MSYILDALKKSAEERRRVQDPTPLLYGPPVAGNSDRRMRRTTRSLLAPLLLCLALLIAIGWYWLAARPFDFSSTSTTVLHNQPETPPAPSDANQSAPAAVPESPPTNIQPPTNEPQPTAAIDQVDKQAPTPSRQPAQLPLLEDLPPSVQETLPNIRFSGHVFSPEPSLRMIMANQAIVREQDLISPGVRLEEITETGVLLSYQGTRFRVELLPPL